MANESELFNEKKNKQELEQTLSQKISIPADSFLSRAAESTQRIVDVQSNLVPVAEQTGQIVSRSADKSQQAFNRLQELQSLPIPEEILDFVGLITRNQNISPEAQRNEIQRAQFETRTAIQKFEGAKLIADSQISTEKAKIDSDARQIIVAKSGLELLNTRRAFELAELQQRVYFVDNDKTLQTALIDPNVLPSIPRSVIRDELSRRKNREFALQATMAEVEAAKFRSGVARVEFFNKSIDQFLLNSTEPELQGLLQQSMQKGSNGSVEIAPGIRITSRQIDKALNTVRNEILEQQKTASTFIETQSGMFATFEEANERAKVIAVNFARNTGLPVGDEIDDPAQISALLPAGEVRTAYQKAAQIFEASKTLPAAQAFVARKESIDELAKIVRKDRENAIQSLPKEQREAAFQYFIDSPGQVINGSAALEAATSMILSPDPVSGNPILNSAINRTRSVFLEKVNKAEGTINLLETFKASGELPIGGTVRPTFERLLAEAVEETKLRSTVLGIYSVELTKSVLKTLSEGEGLSNNPRFLGLYNSKNGQFGDAVLKIPVDEETGEVGAAVFSIDNLYIELTNRESKLKSSGILQPGESLVGQFNTELATQLESLKKQVFSNQSFEESVFNRVAFQGREGPALTTFVSGLIRKSESIRNDVNEQITRTTRNSQITRSRGDFVLPPTNPSNIDFSRANPFIDRNDIDQRAERILSDETIK